MHVLIVPNSEAISMAYKRLIDIKTQKEIEIGATVTTFRGEEVIVRGFRAPNDPSSSGKVYVEHKNGQTQEYFPSVIGAVIKVQ